MTTNIVISRDLKAPFWTGQERFLCVWDRGYVEPGATPHITVVEASFFTPESGYDHNEIARVQALIMGESIDLTDGSGFHTVTRLED